MSAANIRGLPVAAFVLARPRQRQAKMPEVRTIEASIRGRYLVAAPEKSAPRGLLVGCHGYAEQASIQMERLQAIPGLADWLLVSVQGLHRFYRPRSQEVIASWMTREDRELALSDNSAFVSAVVDAVMGEWRVVTPLVFAGFSQGAAMAFRAACVTSRPVAAVVALGGDLPPELGRDALARLPAVLLGRGDHDQWYSPEQFAADERRLRAAGVELTVFGFAAAHLWTSVFSDAVGSFLSRFHEPAF
jgi:predicted esterase